MSTALERLKAMAAAKKAAEAQSEEKDNVQSTIPSSPVDSDNANSVCSSNLVEESSNENPDQTSVDASGSELASAVSASDISSDHPLKMQLAELEQALTEKLPEFRTILRDIHSKLRQDPAIVTAMSEEEVSIVVSGLIAHANMDVIAPASVKAAKKATRTPINASDL